MKASDVKKVGVLGCGVMGRTLAATMSTKYEVVVKEANQALADKGLQGIAACYPALMKRNVINEEQKNAALARVKMTTSLDPFKDCQFIIDAVPDDLKLKLENLAPLNKMCPPETVLSTVSSIIPVTALATGSGRPDRFIGAHFSNPAHLMALVEVAPGIQTSKETIDFTFDFCKSLGKTPVRVQDWPGYIVNYLFFPYLVSAVKALEAGLASIEDIDAAAKLGLGHAMGPLESIDMFGVDAVVDALNVMKNRTNDLRFAPPPLLSKMCDAGWTGRKSGKGFYDYSGGQKKASF